MEDRDPPSAPAIAEADPRAGTTSRALLSFREVLNWIAFGKLTDDDLVDEDRASMQDPELLRVLEAIAADVPLPEEENDFPTYKNFETKLPYWDRRRPRYSLVEGAALTMLDETGKTAAELAGEVRKRIAGRAEREVRFHAAIEQFVEAHLLKKFDVVAAPNAGAYRGRTSPDRNLKELLIGMPRGWLPRNQALSLWPPVNPSQAAPKPPVSLADLRGFWLSYVKGMDGQRPTFDEAFTALKSAFPGRQVTVARYKALRQSSATPESWKRAGKRSQSKRDANSCRVD